MTFDIRKKEDLSEDGKRFSVELSLSGLIGFCATLVLGLVWVFIFGVLVGRNYQPAPEMPGQNQTTAQEESVQETASTQEVLKPEELAFYNDLQDTGNQAQAPAPQPAPTPQPSPQPHPQAEPAPAPQPVAQAEPAPAPAPQAEPAPAPQPEPEIQPESQETVQAEQPEPPIVESPPEDDQIYSYRYQVASFKDMNAARAFVEKVASIGLEAEIESIDVNGNLWHRVIVMFQGRPIETRAMKEKLETLGVDKPLLNSKIPI